MKENEPLALYLHIPFCRSKCAYCDFASYPEALSLLPAYLDALRKEIAQAARAYGRREVRTVFLGGGTPSLLSGRQLTELMAALRASFELLPEAEITMEANPGTLNAENLAAYRDAGVNRLSLGAQAGQERLLQALGRIHRWQDVTQAVRMVREAGFDNLSIDLIFGLPGQTPEDWRETLEAAVALDVEHLSCYALILEPGTPLHTLYTQGEITLPNEETEREMYQSSIDFLAEAGYAQYELSNFAKPGYPCRHNLVYWERGEYLGLGTAAHSLMGERRFGNTPSLTEYLAAMEPEGSPVVECEEVTEEGKTEELIMLGLRLNKGLDGDTFRRETGHDLMVCYEKQIERLTSQGLLESDGRHLRLTRRGMDVHSAVVADLLFGV